MNNNTNNNTTLDNIKNIDSRVYLDNAATTRTDDDAAGLALKLMCDIYANPSSAHAFGFEAEKLLKEARQNILRALNVSASDGTLIFTSCGTESDNMAIRSAVRVRARKGKHIVISDSEHPAVENTVKELEKEGYEASRIPTRGGKIDLEYAKSVLRRDTVLVSCMAVNNETGAIYDIPALARITRLLSPDALFHTDAVQAFTKINPAVFSCADLVSISGHKIHAPKGIGALFVKKGVRVLPLIYGGGQENNLRSGTEAMPAVCAFGLAAKKASEQFDERLRIVADLNKKLREKLSEIPGVSINSGTIGFDPHIMSISVDGIRSELLLRFLSERGVYVSAGSACSSKHADNRVLAAFGLDESTSDSTIRISFSHFNTPEHIDIFVKNLNEGINSLIALKSRQHN